MEFLDQLLSYLIAMKSFSLLLRLLLETDEISTRIIRYLNSDKGGRVTFIPLNKAKAPHVNYPHSSDVVPLLKKLKFSSHHTQAFQQVDLKKQKLQEAKANVDDAKRQLKVVSDEIDQIAKRMKSIKDEKNKLKALEGKYVLTLQDEVKEVEQLVTKKSSLLEKQEDCMKKIRDLGSLLLGAFERYTLPHKDISTK